MKLPVNLLIILVFISGISSHAQLSELLHLKTFPGNHPFRVFHLEKDSVYIVENSLSSQTFDASIWPDDPDEMITSELNTIMMMYDYDFQYLGIIQTPAYSIMYEPLKKAGNNWIFNSNVRSGQQFSEFESIPPLTGDYPSPVFGNSVVLRYNDETETMAMPFHCLCVGDNDFAHNQIYPGIAKQMYGHGQFWANRFAGAYMSDGTVVTTKYLIRRITLNWEELIEIDNGYWGNVWLKINPLSGSYIATPLYSNTGAALSHALFPSDDANYIYRTGVVFGNDVPISPDGSLWQASDSDSLFYAFMVKENAVGEREWIQPLYAYGNKVKSSASNAEMDSYSVVELDDAVFLSHSARLFVGQGDTLYFKDIDGNEETHTASNTGILGHGSYNIFKFDQNGEPIARLEYPMLPSQMNHPVYSANQQPPYLFKVAGKLGWVHNYTANNDTTIQFMRSETDGEEVAVDIDLPAGQGAYIAWLDSDLNLVDILNIPFQGSFFPGVTIHHVSLYREDSLLVSGDIAWGVTTRMDPEGLADEVTYDGITGFIGFYTLPSVLVGVNQKEEARQSHFTIYPNPAKGSIQVRSDLSGNAEYVIHDLYGRRLKAGKLNRASKVNTIQMDRFTLGMYVISIQGEGVTYSEKFIME